MLSSSKDRSAPSNNRPKINKYFEAMLKAGASDMHFKADGPARVRLSGGFKALKGDPLTNEKIERMIFEIMNEHQLQLYEEKGSADFSYQMGKQRFRINVFRQRGYTSMAARAIPREIKNYDELHLPPILAEIANKHQGLILVSGITGSGKSTTIASMIEQINKTRSNHIVTLEDPIEFMFEDKKSFINQREIGQDVLDFHDALKYLMREDPDVVLVGELRDPETFEAALHAAESGHLCFGTVHASNAPSTVTRVLELFPPHARDLVRSSLVFNLQAIIALKLLKGLRPDVPRLPAVEIMIATPGVRKMIADKRENELLGVIRNSANEGMQDFTESLRYLVENEFISTHTAYEVAPNPEELKMRLKGITMSSGGLVG